MSLLLQLQTQKDKHMVTHRSGCGYRDGIEYKNNYKRQTGQDRKHMKSERKTV